MKTLGIILALAVLYLGLELLFFWYRAAHLPQQAAINQSDKTFGQGPALKYIAAGDSTGVGIGASQTQNSYAYKLAEYLAKDHTVEYKNIAVSGYKTQDVIDKQLAEIIAYQPDIVTLSIGANDATHLLSSQKIISNYKTIISRLESQTTAKIYITDIAHFKGAKLLPWFFKDLIEWRSAKINPQLLALGSLRTTIINIHDFGWENYPDLSVTYSADQFHPSDLGYQNWANAFLDKIEKDY